MALGIQEMKALLFLPGADLYAFNGFAGVCNLEAACNST